MVGCPRAAAAVYGCEVMRDRWVVPHFAVRTCFYYSRWLARVSLPVQRTPLWPASWLPVLDKSRGSKAAEVQSVWDVYDDRLQFMSRDDALNLDGSLANGDGPRPQNCIPLHSKFNRPGQTNTTPNHGRQQIHNQLQPTPEIKQRAVETSRYKDTSLPS